MIKQGVKFVLILLFICAGFFCFGKNCWAVSAGDVVISEIQIGGDSVYDEFIELYNPTDVEIDLEEWDLKRKTSSGSESNMLNNIEGIIPAYGYFLIVPRAQCGDSSDKNCYKGLVPADDEYTTKSYLSKNNTVLLYDNNGILIDKVGWGEAGDFESEVIIDNPENNQSIERININGVIQDTNNNKNDFVLRDNPYPQNSNSLPEQPSDEISNGNGDDSNNGIDDGEDEEDNEQQGEQEQEEDEDVGEAPSKIIITNKLGDIVINEFVSDPADEDVEWIELYNTTSKEINLDGWTIKEGSGAKTTLEGILAGSGEGKFMIIEKPKGNLNNKGDIIILRDDHGTLIDQVTYGNWDDGNTNNNAPVTGDPYSVARKFDGQNSFNNANDFVVTTTLTKGTSNIITKTEEEQELADEISAKEKALYDYSNDIIISEVFPNPLGSDSEDEFIELYNKSERDVNLLGWRLGDESKKKYKIANLSEFEASTVNAIIKAGGYLVVYRSESKIALNNGSDSVKLYQPLKDEPLQVVKYEKSIEGWSYNFEGETSTFRLQNYNYVWSEIVTPGAVNEIKTINHPPIVDFDCPEEILVGAPTLFDSSDTVDEDGDELKFSWDFGDGFTNKLANPEHTFFKQGAYTVKLTVSDGENEVEKEKIVKVVSDLNMDGAETTGLLRHSVPLSLHSIPRNDNVVINEFLPNPEGADAEGEFIELYNQGNADVNLINWKVDDSEGGSKPYSFDLDLWLNSGMYYVLDREESGLALNNTTDAVRLFNNFNELIEEIEYEAVVEGEAYARGKNGKWFWTTVITPGEENVISVADSRESKVIVKSASYSKNTKKVKQIVETTLEKISECEVGDLVKVAGIVAVKPGVLGSQYFYIVGSAGIQVYNYKKDFPNLKVGDYIEVQGELSVSSGELRLKTKIQDDFKIIEHREPPIANEASCEQVDEKYVGQLISVTGEVVERKSSIVYLDDGTDEVIVYLKKSTGINPKSIKEGEIVAVTGLVGRTKSGIRIMPRSSNDIIKKDPQSHSGEVSQVLGEVAVSDVWEIAQRDKKIELFKYLLILAGGVIVVLGGLLVKGVRRG